MTATATRAGTASRPPSDDVRFGHRPGLDGIRGLAVAAVLAFHADASWARGGYLGVSAFFTLSGFLITALLLTERERAGRISLPAFWARRARRLLPAALLGIGVAVSVSLVTGDATEVAAARGDALSALAYVANWRFVFRDLSYADLFASASPLQHLWSLAIEEQFYLVLPLVAVVALRRGNRTRRLGAAAAALLVGSVAVNLVVSGTDRRYYGTDTRAVELLAGVALACLFHSGALRRVPATVRQSAGIVALAGTAISWSVLGQTTPWLHPWGLLVHAFLICAVLVAALDGPVGAALGARALAGLGRISYGVYLYHWPLYLLLDHERTGLDGPFLAVVRVAATLATALVSYRFVERPIRYPARRRPARDLGIAAVAVGAGALAVAVATTVLAPAPLIDFDAAAALAESLATTSTTAAGPVTTSTTSAPAIPAASIELPTPTRIAVFGDSTALLLVPGLLAWQEAHPDQIEVVEGRAAVGCSIGRDGVRLDHETQIPLAESCDFGEVWPGVLDRGKAQVAVVQIGLWDLVDRILTDGDIARHWGDPVYDAYLRSETRAAVDLLSSSVLRTVWVLQPTPVASTRDPADPVLSRLPSFNEAVRAWLADRPDVAFVDLRAWIVATGQQDSTALRPDGTHFSTETSATVAEWLVPAILAAARDGGVVGPDDLPPDPATP